MKDRIYQLIIARIDGEKIGSREYEEYILKLVRMGVSGFIIFGGKRDRVKGFVNHIQSVAEVPLFIGSDIERGVGQQIEDATPFPSQMAFAAAIDKNNSDDVDLFRESLSAIADEAIDCGINMVYAPTLDVNRNPDNPIICTRAFSDDPRTVEWFGCEYIKAFEARGLISCGKHFPGHGDTTVDSHISLPVIAKSYQELLDVDVMPYRQAIKDGMSSVMVGHLSIPAIDRLPASMSINAVSGLLRYKLGFGGLILTDALTMSALKDFDNVAAQCLNAGVDILLHPGDVDETVRDVEEALKQGTLREEQIETALERVARTKKRIAAYARGAGDQKPEDVKGYPSGVRGAPVDYKKDEELSAKITGKAVSLVAQKNRMIPVDKEASVIFAGDDSNFESSPFKKYFPQVSRLGQTAHTGKTLIVAIFTSVAAWKGSSGINPESRKEIFRAASEAEHSIVISFGSPYVLRYFGQADMRIAAYDPTEEAQRAVIRCLAGEKPFEGSLPVNLMSVE
ncbi:MAG TPA: glycoside hydrolase family 3 N-terminal domain-containing protein [Syntrophorhabdaceae bacterium]|nr:glycoside hydrolase family 3 N-terminal domain-containing protein [Syntrophorhabdaceae bacterium]